MVSIRPLTKFDEMVACEDVGRRTWGLDDLQVIPAHQFAAVADHGGLILGAFDDVTNEQVAWSYAFLGKISGETGLFSFGLAVVPECRSRGIGRRLKLAQRDWALAEGHRLIAWTYDPLRAINGHLYLTRLGGVAHDYLEDTFGTRGLGTRATGMPVDEVLVRWRLDSPRVIARLAGGSVAVDRSLPVFQPLDLEDPSAGSTDVTGLREISGDFLLQIPRDIQQLRKADMDLARRWRFGLRRFLRATLSAGYVMTECVEPQEADDGYSVYLLEKTEPSTIGPW